MEIDVQNLPVTLSVEKAAAQIGVSRRTIYKLIDTGELRSMKVGRRRLIPRAAIAEYVASREATA